MCARLKNILHLRHSFQPDINPAKKLTNPPQHLHNIHIPFVPTLTPNSQLLNNNTMQSHQILHILQPNIPHNSTYNLHNNILILTITYL